MTEQLRRTLGVRAAVGVGLGSMLGAGVFVVWGPAAAAAGSWLLLALLVAAVVAVCNAWSSAALAVRDPAAGGAYVHGTRRLGPLPGYLAGWAFVTGKTASCAAMAMTVGAYAVPGRERAAAVVAVVLVTALNLGGVQRAARVSEVVAAGVLVVLAALALVAAGDAVTAGVWPAPEWPSGGSPAPATGAGGADVTAAAVGPWGVLQAAGLLFFAFAGYARIATLAEEVRDPGRTIPRAVLVTVTVVLLAYAVVGVLVLGVLGPVALAGSAAPVAEVAAALGSEPWVWAVRVTATVAALGALLNLVLGISRTALAMARDGHLPAPLGRLAGPRRVPVVGEVTVGLVVLLVVLVADVRGAIGFSSFGVLLYYAVANAAAWRLRDWRWARTVPVVGFLGCLVLAAALPGASVAGGLVVLAGGLGWYAVRQTVGHGRGPTGTMAR